MLSSLSIPILAAAALLPAAAAQDAQDILETVRTRQAERTATVDNYTVVQSISGMSGIEAPVYYEKIDLDGQPAFRMVPIGEYERARAETEGLPTSPEELRLMADAQEQLGQVFDQGMRDQGAPVLPGFDPGAMMGETAMFLRAGADSFEEQDQGDGGRGDAAETARGMAEFSRRASLVGRETIDGREAFLLRADDVSDIELGQMDDDARVTLKTMSLWIDTEHYVSLRMKIDMDVESDGEVTPMTVERLDQDYRQVGPMYESHRQVMRISGMMAAMDEDERKEMEKAQADMAELEAQLDQMPAAARSMMEKQLGKVRQQMAAFSSGGVFESTIDVVRIEINQGPPRPQMP